MSTLQNNQIFEQSSKPSGVRSSNKKIHVYMEVAYSQSRKNEMMAADEKNCTLLTLLLQNHLQKLGAMNIETWAPTSMSRFADIIYEFDIDSEVKLENIETQLKKLSTTSIDKIELFVEEY